MHFLVLTMVADKRDRGILDEPVLILTPSEEYGKVMCENWGRAAAFSITGTWRERLRGWGLMRDDKLNLLFQRKWHQYLLRSIGGPWEADTSSTCWELQHHLKAMAVNIVFSAFWEVPKGSHLPRSERYVSSLRSWTMVYWNVTHSLLSFFSFLLSLRILLSFIFFPMKFLDTPRQ